MAIEIPGVDEEIFVELFDNDTGLYVFVVRTFVDNLPETLNRLKNVSKETLPDYAIKIHGLKGACATICAKEAEKTAQKLETMAKNGDLSGIMVGNEAFLKYMNNLLDNLQNWLKDK